MPRLPDPAPVPSGVRTLADFLHWIGDVPPERVLLRPPPGMANANDVLRLARQEARLCELVHGVLVERRLGYKDMSVAAALMAALQQHVEEKRLGVVTGPEGFYRLSDHLVRAPSVAFCAAGSHRGDLAPGEAAAGIVPQLVAEIDDGTTPAELARRIEDYFAARVKLVWVIHLDRRTATAYTSPTKSSTIPASGTLDAGRLLKGFNLPLARLFEHFGAVKRR
jgi:putative restriction endonuclease